MGKRVSCSKVADKVGKCANVTKWIMGIAFFLLFILAVAMFGVCCTALTNSKLLGDMSIKGFTALMYMGLFLGLFLGIVTILGAIGYFTLNRTLLIIVTCSFILLAVLQILCGSLAFAYKNDYEDFITDAWDAADNSTRAYLEEEFDCCGGVNSTYETATWACNHTLIDGSDGDGGCVDKLTDFAKDKILPVGGGLIAITVLEIVIIVVTIIIARKIRHVHNYYKVQEQDTMEAFNK